MSPIISLRHTLLPSVSHITHDTIRVLGMSCSAHHNLGVSTMDSPPASPLTFASVLSRPGLLAEPRACPTPCWLCLPVCPVSARYRRVTSHPALQTAAALILCWAWQGWLHRKSAASLVPSSLPPFGRWRVHAALLGPMGRLSASKVPRPSARVLPSTGRT